MDDEHSEEVKVASNIVMNKTYGMCSTPHMFNQYKENTKYNCIHNGNRTVIFNISLTFSLSVAIIL